MGLARYYCGQFVRNYLPRDLGQRAQRTRKAFAAWRLERAKNARKKRHGTMSAADLHDSLTAAGVRSGCVTLVHSSFGDFTNFDGTALDVLEVLEQLVGPQGTLVMPAQYVSKKDAFNVQRHPASVGLLCELFRRREGVVRSAHPGQSVCAKGPAAESLIREHHTHPLGCGPASPFAKLLEHDSQIIGLGLPPLWTTFLHVVEDLDLDGYPLRMYGDAARTFAVIGVDGAEQQITVPQRSETILAKINPRWLARHVSPMAQQSFSVKGLPCFLAHPKPLYEELKELAARGITAYGRSHRRSA